MNKTEWITERTRIISDMLDNPDENGIYPTTKCYEELDALYDAIAPTATTEGETCDNCGRGDCRFARPNEGTSCRYYTPTGDDNG